METPQFRLRGTAAPRRIRLVQCGKDTANSTHCKTQNLAFCDALITTKTRQIYCCCLSSSAFSSLIATRANPIRNTDPTIDATPAPAALARAIESACRREFDAPMMHSTIAIAVTTFASRTMPIANDRPDDVLSVGFGFLRHGLPVECSLDGTAVNGASSTSGTLPPGMRTGAVHAGHSRVLPACFSLTMSVLPQPHDTLMRSLIGVFPVFDLSLPAIMGKRCARINPISSTDSTQS